MNINMKLPHWMIVLFTTLAGLCTAATTIPTLSQYAPFEVALALLFGAAAGTTGIVSHSAVVATPSPVGSTTGMHGFATVRAMALLVCFVPCACAAALAALPLVSALGICVVDFVETNPGLTLVEYVAQATLKCGGDALAILDELVSSTSTSPAVVALRNEAKALKAGGGPKLQAFVGSVHMRVGALRAAAGVR
jgi:FAD/FMN-containing dehydrogenase